MREFRYLRFPEINSGRCCSVIVRIYRKKLFKLFLNKFLFDDAAPYSKKFVLRFTTIKNLRRGLRALQLFEHYFRIRFKSKKKPITTKLPGLFCSDIQEERSVFKDETMLSTRKRGKKYKFTKYGFGPSLYRTSLRDKMLSKRRSKIFSVVAGALGDNLISPKFLYHVGFTKNSANFHLTGILGGGLSCNFYHLLALLNSVHLMLWLRRLIQINLIINANNSSNIIQR